MKYEETTVRKKVQQENLEAIKAEKKAKARAIAMKHGMLDVSKEFRKQNKDVVSAINPLFKKKEERVKLAYKSREMDVQKHIDDLRLEKLKTN